MRCAPPAILIAAMLGALLAACGFVGGSQATPQPVAASPTPVASPPVLLVLPVASPSPGPGSESSANAEAQAAMDAALRDAAGRLSLATGAGDIHVQQVEPRQWPDSSLGCPREGVMYSQVITPGYLVIVSAAGKQLEYHADSRGRIVFCQEL